DAHGDLQCIESARFHGIKRSLPVAAIPDEARFAGIASLSDDVDDVTLPQLLLGAAMQLQQIHAIRLQTLQASVDGLSHSLRIPVIAIVRVTALGEQEVVVAPAGNGAADLLLAVDITFGGVDDVQSRIEGAVDQLVDRFEWRASKTDFRSAVAEDSNLHAGLAEGAFFHMRTILTCGAGWHD